MKLGWLARATLTTSIGKVLNIARLIDCSMLLAIESD
jgi:hypothetical protein